MTTWAPGPAATAPDSTSVPQPWSGSRALMSANRPGAAGSSAPYRSRIAKMPSRIQAGLGTSQRCSHSGC
ncbi:MAG TPA: hypothetical protein VFW50_24860 [Streptosporangiaceae bacterium]|nr:hypothetical protein [Streptosporangiaceae bacterium]